jgi:hypothetical protein
VQNLATSIWRQICEFSFLTQDLCIYVLAGFFALLNAIVAAHTDYREWGLISFAPYFVAAIAIVAISRLHHRRTWTLEQLRNARTAVVVFLAITAVLVPLLSELTWRATSTQGAHAQQEVAVIERAGDRLALGNNPYPQNPTNIGVNPSNDARNVDVSSYFPYMPGMAIFGLLNATSLPPELGDARVLLVLFALAAFYFALRLTRASPERKLRALQFFMVLPTGALPMVTGGDDLPVISLILLSLVLLYRRAPLCAGMVAAIACSLKFTAWPIALLALLATRPHDRERSTWFYLLGLGLLVPCVLAGLVGNVHAFVDNAIRFPLGLTNVKSPAASPLVGQLLVTLLPHSRRLVTAILAFVGCAIVGYALWKFRPSTVVAVTKFSAFVLCVATVLAPATRFGYLIYPTVLFVWAYVLTGSGNPHLDDERARLG